MRALVPHWREPGFAPGGYALSIRMAISGDQPTASAVDMIFQPRIPMSKSSRRARKTATRCACSIHLCIITGALRSNGR